MIRYTRNKIGKNDFLEIKDINPVKFIDKYNIQPDDMKGLEIDITIIKDGYEMHIVYGHEDFLREMQRRYND